MATRKPKQDKAMITPKSVEELNEFIARIGKIQRQIEQKELVLNNQIEIMRKQAAEQAAPLNKQIDDLVKGAYLFAELNRETLTDKFQLLTVVFPSGTIAWRKNPDSVQVENDEQAITELETGGFSEYVRIKKSVNKETLIGHPEIVEKLSQVSIKEGTEDFILKPNETKIGFAKGPRKVKRETIE